MNRAITAALVFASIAICVRSAYPEAVSYTVAFREDPNFYRINHQFTDAQGNFVTLCEGTASAGVSGSPGFVPDSVNAIANGQAVLRNYGVVLAGSFTYVGALAEVRAEDNNPSAYLRIVPSNFVSKPVSAAYLTFEVHGTFDNLPDQNSQGDTQPPGDVGFTLLINQEQLSADYEFVGTGPIGQYSGDNVSTYVGPARQTFTIGASSNDPYYFPFSESFWIDASAKYTGYYGIFAQNTVALTGVTLQTPDGVLSPSDAGYTLEFSNGLALSAPEPSTVVLAGFGAAAIAFSATRRRR